MAASIFPFVKAGNEEGMNADTTLQFRMSPTHVSYANTLRRLCVAHVPTVAFRADILENDIVDETGKVLQAKGSTSDVQILENTTPMTNEMLAHRVGLIPIHVPNPEDWSAQKGREKYVFELEVTNPNPELLDVTTNDFKVKETTAEGEVVIKPASEYFPMLDGYACLLATLKPFVKSIQSDQEKVHIRARASVGIGRENARFIPVSRATYSYTRIEPSVTNHAEMKTNTVILAAYDDWLSKKGTSRDSLKEKAAEEQALWNEFLTNPIQRYYLKDETTNEPNSFDFVIESVGVLNPRVIVQRALKAGVDLCKKYESSANWSNVTVQLADTRFLAYDFYFQKEDHTLGNLIQTYIDQEMMDNPDYGITFVGYDIPHPLTDEMVLRIGVEESRGKEQAMEIVATAMKQCAIRFETYLKDWNIAAGLEKAVTVQAPSGLMLTPSGKLKRTIKKPTA